jgi:hypothetical protein
MISALPTREGRSFERLKWAKFRPSPFVSNKDKNNINNISSENDAS